MEYIDILDKNGSKTGLTKPKPEVHKNGDWHKASHIWIINSNNELLIQKRSSNKENYPNVWDISAAGHLSAGEDSVSSALRETEEELGLKLNKDDFLYLFSITEQIILNKGTYLDNEFSDVYLVRNDTDISDIRIQKEEVSEIKFINFRQLKGLIKTDANNFVPHPEEYNKLFEFLEKNSK